MSIHSFTPQRKVTIAGRLLIERCLIRVKLRIVPDGFQLISTHIITGGAGRQIDQGAITGQRLVSGSTKAPSEGPSLR